MDFPTCPHCGAVTTVDSQFCESCGKAVPSGGVAGPRFVGAGGVATTAAGQHIQSEELQKQLKKAAGALLAVAILQAIFGTLIIVLAGATPGVPPAAQIGPALYVTVYGIALVFFGLYLWARKSPFPAAIVGLVVFVTVHLLDAVADPTALVRGIIVKVIVILILVRAVQAGAKYRELVSRMPAE